MGDPWLPVDNPAVAVTIVAIVGAVAHAVVAIMRAVQDYRVALARARRLEGPDSPAPSADSPPQDLPL